MQSRFPQRLRALDFPKARESSRELSHFPRQASILHWSVSAYGNIQFIKRLSTCPIAQLSARRAFDFEEKLFSHKHNRTRWMKRQSKKRNPRIEVKFATQADEWLTRTVEEKKMRGEEKEKFGEAVEARCAEHEWKRSEEGTRVESDSRFWDECRKDRNLLATFGCDDLWQQTIFFSKTLNCY